MALVVFLRGVNVGGNRTFRPSILAKQLCGYDVVNVGAAGTFVVRTRVSRAKLLAALMKKLPFETAVMICDGRDVLSIASANPFRADHLRPDVVRFISILPETSGVAPAGPVALPASSECFLQIIASKGRFAFGVYRRHMKTISYLGQIDKLVGARVTTRNWNTIMAIVRILNAEEQTSQNRILARLGSKLPARADSAKIRP